MSWTGTDSGAHLNLARLVDEPSLGDYFVKLAPDLSLADWFSPWNTQILNQADTDLGSGGALVLPGAGLIVGGGKEGKLYVLDPNHLGHFRSTCGNPAGDTQIIQWFQATGTNKGSQNPPQPAVTCATSCGTARCAPPTTLECSPNSHHPPGRTGGST
jgi:hypothetical protein